MQFSVRLFAALREAAGSDAINLELPSDATAGDLLQALARALPTVAGLLPACRVALDAEYVESTRLLAGAAEVAIIPPVSGG